MANRWHSGLFDLDKLKKFFVDVPKTLLKGGTPLEPIKPIPNPTKDMKLKGRLPMRKLGK